jgi:hypothetical protein
LVAHNIRGDRVAKGHGLPRHGAVLWATLGEHHGSAEVRPRSIRAGKRNAAPVLADPLRIEVAVSEEVQAVIHSEARQDRAPHVAGGAVLTANDPSVCRCDVRAR